MDTIAMESLVMGADGWVAGPGRCFSRGNCCYLQLRTAWDVR